MRRHPEATRHSLAAIFCFQREQEIADGLVELLIQIVHRISVRADRKVVKELLEDVQKVQGKTTLLFKLAEAALDHPEGVVKEVLYPVVSEVTLRNLIIEGVLRHCTTMEIENQYVDSHGRVKLGLPSVIYWDSICYPV